jgi:hypothetical protein
MRIRTMLIGATIAASAFGVTSANADGEFCYDVQATVAGGQVVNEQGCQTIPTELPSAPELPPVPDLPPAP